MSLTKILEKLKCMKQEKKHWVDNMRAWHGENLSEIEKSIDKIPQFVSRSYNGFFKTNHSLDEFKGLLATYSLKARIIEQSSSCSYGLYEKLMSTEDSRVWGFYHGIKYPGTAIPLNKYYDQGFKKGGEVNKQLSGQLLEIIGARQWGEQ